MFMAEIQGDVDERSCCACLPELPVHVTGWQKMGGEGRMFLFIIVEDKLWGQLNVGNCV